MIGNDMNIKLGDLVKIRHLGGPDVPGRPPRAGSRIGVFVEEVDRRNYKVLVDGRVYSLYEDYLEPLNEAVT